MGFREVLSGICPIQSNYLMLAVWACHRWAQLENSASAEATGAVRIDQEIIDESIIDRGTVDQGFFDLAIFDGRIFGGGVFGTLHVCA